MVALTWNVALYTGVVARHGPGELVLCDRVYLMPGPGVAGEMGYGARPLSARCRPYRNLTNTTGGARLGLVAVGRGRVDVAVAGLQRDGDRRLRLLGRNLVAAEAEPGGGVPVVQRQRGYRRGAHGVCVPAARRCQALARRLSTRL